MFQTLASFVIEFCQRCFSPDPSGSCRRKKIPEVTLFGFATIKTLANDTELKQKRAESIRPGNFVGYKLEASSQQRTAQIVVFV